MIKAGATSIGPRRTGSLNQARIPGLADLPGLASMAVFLLLNLLYQLKCDGFRPWSRTTKQSLGT